MGQREKVRKLRWQWRTLTAVFWPKCICECNVLVIKVFKLLVKIKEIIRGLVQTLFKKHKQKNKKKALKKAFKRTTRKWFGVLERVT